MTTAPAYAEVHVELAERPDDSPVRCAFEPISEVDVASRLAALAQPQRAVFDPVKGYRADSIAFQPCTGYRSQDRHVVQQLNVHGQKWTFTGVFDGHLGDATVQHTAYHLPIIVKQFLQKALPGPSSPTPPPDVVRDILSRAVTSFDDAIAGDILELFPGGIDSLDGRSDEEIQAVVNDFAGSGKNYQKARLCLYGTTALVALIDPAHENLWVANLGDCEAVLVTPAVSGGMAHVEVLNELHNGLNPAEVARIHREHPGEKESVLNDRVLGTIAPFRCIGDAPFKQPATFTRRVLYNLYPGVPDPTPWEVFLSRNRTPPYISSEPDVLHRRLNPNAAPAFLILATDGLTEQYDGMERDEMAEDWARCVSNPASTDENLALRLLHHALGGEADAMRVSQMMTLDMRTPWMDDTTIVVQVL